MVWNYLSDYVDRLKGGFSRGSERFVTFVNPSIDLANRPAEDLSNDLAESEDCIACRVIGTIVFFTVAAGSALEAHRHRLKSVDRRVFTGTALLFSFLGTYRMLTPAGQRFKKTDGD